MEQVTDLDVRRVQNDLRERLAMWRGTLRLETVQARQLGQKLVAGRLIFTLGTDTTGRFYAFAGEAALGRLLAGTVNARAMVTPAGSDAFWSFPIRAVAVAWRRREPRARFGCP